LICGAAGCPANGFIRLKDALPDLPIAGGRLQARLDLAGTLAAPSGTLQSALGGLMLLSTLGLASCQAVVHAF